MQTFERTSNNARAEHGLAIEQSRRNSLAEYEKELANEKGNPWWPLSGGGVQDETGAIWAVYNRWCDETKPTGWRIYYCEEDGAEFREIKIPYNKDNPTNGVVRTEIYPRKDSSHDKLVAYQLMVHHDPEAGFRDRDVLNVLQYQSNGMTVETKINFWNQKSFMEPVEWRVEPELQETEHTDSQVEIVA